MTQPSKATKKPSTPVTGEKPESQWKQDRKAGATDLDTGEGAEREQGNRALRKTAGGSNPHVGRHRS